MQARVNILAPEKRPLQWFKTVYNYIENRVEDADGPTADELRRLSDDALRKQIDKAVQLAEDFIRELWTRVKGGATPRQCEEAIATDSYRVRALLAHWLTSGALEIREADSHRAP